MNKYELLGVIASHGDTQRELAHDIGISLAALSSKINGKYDFKSSEISDIRQRYHLSNDQIVSIFFEDGVSQKLTGGVTIDTTQSV